MRVKSENTTDKITRSFKTKEVLCGDIWDGATGTPSMKEDVREQLMGISDEFLDFLVIELDIADIIMTGSLSNYNWSEFSDIALIVKELIGIPHTILRLKVLKLSCTFKTRTNLTSHQECIRYSKIHGWWNLNREVENLMRKN